MVFVNKSRKCHMWMFQHSNTINSVIRDFREVVGYFYDEKCRQFRDAKFKCLYQFILN